MINSKVFPKQKQFCLKMNEADSYWDGFSNIGLILTVLGVNVDNDDKNSMLLSSVENVSKYMDVATYLWQAREVFFDDIIGLLTGKNQWVKEQIENVYNINIAIVIGWRWKKWVYKPYASFAGALGTRGEVL